MVCIWKHNLKKSLKNRERKALQIHSDWWCYTLISMNQGFYIGRVVEFIEKHKVLFSSKGAGRLAGLEMLLGLKTFTLP